MHARSRARGWALQALYAWETRGGEPAGAVDMLEDLAEDSRISPTNRFFADVLVRLVARDLAQLDRILQEQLANWRLDRLSAIDRNILRLGIAELLYVDDIPARITVREMVRLAERYGTAESPRFINGVLEGVMRKVLPDKVVEDG